MNRTSLLVVTASLSFVLLAGAACRSQEGNKTLTLGNAQFNNHGTKSAVGKGELELVTDSFYFEPTFLQGAPGQKLKLAIRNEAGIQHNLTVVGQDIDQDIPAKGQLQVVVTFPQAGVVRFFCKFHTGTGMNGELLAGSAQPQAAAASIST